MIEIQEVLKMKDHIEERETKMREFIVENIKAAKEEMAITAQSKITQNNNEYIQNQLSGVLKKAEYKIKLQDESCAKRLETSKTCCDKSKEELLEKISRINSKHSKDTNFLMSQNSRIEMEIKKLIWNVESKLLEFQKHSVDFENHENAEILSILKKIDQTNEAIKLNTQDLSVLKEEI